MPRHLLCKREGRYPRAWAFAGGLLPFLSSLYFPPEMATEFLYPVNSSTYTSVDGNIVHDVPCFVSADVEAEAVVCPVRYIYASIA